MDRADRCISCGTSEWEWHEDPNAYHPVRWTCPGCQLREIMNKDDTPSPPGTSVRLLPREQAERLEAEAERRKQEGGGRPRSRR